MTEVIDNDGAEDTVAPIRVLVYGTLKAGHPNHRLMRGANMLGKMVLHGADMRTLGAFPGAIRAPGTGNVIFGEVYEITEECLQSLDILEGHPNFYQRQRIRTPYGKAWCYFLPLTFADCEPVSGGIWRPTEQEQAEMAELLKQKEAASG